MFWQERESFYWARRQEMESPAGPALKCAVLLGLQISFLLFQTVRLLCFCYRTIKTVSIQHTVEFLYFCNFFFGLRAIEPRGNKHKQFYLFIKFLSKTRIFVTGNFKILKTFNNGSLGSRIDEERSEMRYVM